jgi:16S rRNA (guanine(966)-N(2))-methyltransferase RsmD
MALYNTFSIVGAVIVKISSGWSKGLKILTPEGLETRPTRERVRQSAINMLQPWIPQATVLDLFAGSGAVGIELVSRGAKGARFVETAAGAYRCLTANLVSAAQRAKAQDILLDPWEALQEGATTYLKSAPAATYDLVWADPPYQLVAEFLRSAADHLSRALMSGGVLALESSLEPGIILGEVFRKDQLTLLKQKTYGVTLITLWEKP